MRTPRRVVTGHNSAGKSIIVSHEPMQGFGEPLPYNIWGNIGVPAQLDASTETFTPPAFFPPKNAAYFKVVRIDKSPEEHGDPEAARKYIREMFAAIGAADYIVDQTRDPGMHRTATIDYLILLTGRLTLLLDEGEVDLEPHDCIIQRGTNHAWINKYDEPALMAVVMVGADLP